MYVSIAKNKARPAGIPRLPHHRHLEGEIHWWGMLFCNSVCKCNCGSRCLIFLCINCYWIGFSGSLCVDSNWISCPGFSRLTAVKIWGLELFQTQNSSMLGRSVSQVCRFRVPTLSPVELEEFKYMHSCSYRKSMESHTYYKPGIGLCGTDRVCEKS